MKNSALSIFVTFSAVFSLSVQAQPIQTKATGVYVAPVKQLEFVDRVEALGNLRANEAVSLASTVTELVTEVTFDDGQRVKKGDLLVQLDVSEELAQQAEEQSRYERAKRQVARFKPLTGRGAASETVLDDARSDMKAARARLAAIDARIAQRRIVAPFDGVVGLRNISVGALTQPGQAIMNIDDDSIMRLDFALPEVFLGSLAIGNSVIATSSAFPDKVYAGVVESIDSRIDPVTRSIIVRARIPNSDRSLKPGLLMRVILKRNPRQALVLQEEALIPNGDKLFVLIAEPSSGGYTAQRRQVEIGARRKGEVEIVSGLSLGELVITHGSIKVSQGSPVTVLAQENKNETLEQLLSKPNVEVDENDSGNAQQDSLQASDQNTADGGRAGQ